jgi:hypothetical protein
MIAIRFPTVRDYVKVLPKLAIKVYPGSSNDLWDIYCTLINLLTNI